MNKYNPECIECGLLKSTTDAMVSPLCSRAKLVGGSHVFPPQNADRTGDKELLKSAKEVK